MMATPLYWIQDQQPIGPVSNIDMVITDSGIKEEEKTRLEKNEVKVIVV